MIVLASRSPRRRHLLRLLGVEFRVRPAGIPEDRLPGESPERCAARLAREKALAVASEIGAALRDGALVLAADTVVALGDDLFGKPRHRADARRMLRALSGRTHRVITGVAIWRGRDRRILAGLSVTQVAFSRLTRADIESYIASGEPLDAAGAYQIQGRGGILVSRIEGSYSNVVGLPLDLVRRLLARAGGPRLSRLPIARRKSL